MKQNTAPAGAPGEHLVNELKWVHGMLRRDLKVLREVADQISSGGSATLVQSAIHSLQTRSPLWQLRVSCLQYCQFVHAHHGGEDAHVFPALRRSNPALAPTVDRLEADHRRISDLLDQVADLANLLGGEDTPDNRKRLVLALNEVSTHLLEHLDFEEEAISPTLRQWTRWPF